MVGRIFGIQQTVTSTLMIAAPLTGGMLIQSLGAGYLFLLLGLLTGALGLLGNVCQRVIWPRAGTRSHDKQLLQGQQLDL
ncbi:hypothetical protein [Paenibacillus gansuensis]|uniref:Major facilitator superfamily (MFS) profile domain-containing protein n=1 Tax=Paenibacillus gansuensis TaxID=306542 RepID=A0ABW5P8E2_9BACL